MSADSSTGQRLAWHVAVAAWLSLIALALRWETWLAPLRPGGSWLVLKALPLLLPLRGVLRGDVKTMQWALLLVLPYIAEGSVRLVDAPAVGVMSVIEIALGAAFFAAAVVYLRPFKKAARARKGR